MDDKNPPSPRNPFEKSVTPDLEKWREQQKAMLTEAQRQRLDNMETKNWQELDAAKKERMKQEPEISRNAEAEYWRERPLPEPRPDGARPRLKTRRGAREHAGRAVELFHSKGDREIADRQQLHIDSFLRKAEQERIQAARKEPEHKPAPVKDDGPQKSPPVKEPDRTPVKGELRREWERTR